ncbi:hypothetical protein F5H01DRAFT_334236 [Linnemannia elongata]|nr:hypothetical protein F5H01DRAFT_334236 [Linnemannia elongata]
MTLFAPPCVWQAENLSFHSEVSVTQNRTCVIVFVYCGRCWCQRGKEKREQDPLSNRVSILSHQPSSFPSLWPFDPLTTLLLSRYAFIIASPFSFPSLLFHPFISVVLLSVSRSQVLRVNVLFLCVYVFGFYPHPRLHPTFFFVLFF